MKNRIIIILSMILLISCVMPICTSAGLTDNQKKTLVEYTDKFLENGNAPISADNKIGRLQYGVKEVWKTYQMILTHNDSLYTNPNDRTSTKILYMVNPEGYANIGEYQRTYAGGRDGYFLEGDYIDLDCSAFVAFIYKAVFGLHFDYAEKTNNNVRNWSTLHYVGNEYASLRKVMVDNMETELFEQILYYTDPSGLMSVSKLTTDISKLEVGDIIIGRNDTTGWGHIMFYGGDGYLYHSSSTPMTNSDGSIAGQMMRKQAIADITSRSYTKMWVLRIKDGILPTDFNGWNTQIDFKSLNFEKSAFDTDAPVVTSIKVTEDYSSGKNTKNLIVRFSDSFGDLKPLYVSGSTTLMRSSGYGESGMFGYYLGNTDKLPENLYDFLLTKTEKATVALADGVYYLWCRDAAENVSQRFTITIGATSTVTRQEADGSETLIGSFAPGNSTVYQDPDKPVTETVVTEPVTAPENTTTGGNESKGCNSTAVSAFVVITAVFGACGLIKRKSKENIG